MAEMKKTTAEFDLDALFAEARSLGDAPGPDLMARVLADALAAQPAPAQAAPIPAPRPSRLRQFLNAVGGWPAVAGLATAGVAGLWIGVNPPAGMATTVASTAESVLGSETDLYLVDLMPGYEFALAEG